MFISCSYSAISFSFLLPMDEVGFLDDMSISPSIELSPKIVIEVLLIKGIVAMASVPFFSQPLLREILMLNPVSSMKT